MPVYNNFQRNAFNQMVPASRRRLHRPLERPGYMSGSEWNEMYGAFGRNASGANTPLGMNYAERPSNQGVTKEGFLEPDYFVPQSFKDNTYAETWRSAFLPEEKFDTFEQAMASGKQARDTADWGDYEKYAAAFNTEPSVEGFGAYRQEKEVERGSEQKARQVSYENAKKVEAEQFSRAMKINAAQEAARESNLRARERAQGRQYQSQKDQRDWRLREINKRESSIISAARAERDPQKRAALRSRLQGMGASRERLSQFDSYTGETDYYQNRFDTGRATAGVSRNVTRGKDILEKRDYTSWGKHGWNKDYFTPEQQIDLQREASEADALADKNQAELKAVEDGIKYYNEQIADAQAETETGIVDEAAIAKLEAAKVAWIRQAKGKEYITRDSTEDDLKSMWTPERVPRWGELWSGRTPRPPSTPTPTGGYQPPPPTPSPTPSPTQTGRPAGGHIGPRGKAWVHPYREGLPEITKEEAYRMTQEEAQRMLNEGFVTERGAAVQSAAADVARRHNIEIR